MCVIYACATSRPDDAELHRGSVENPHGAGIAWIEDKVVRWEKGLKDASEVIKLLSKNSIPLPYVIHFRTASVGGTDPQLTHPFPLDPACPLALQGSTNRGVLFHNGHVSSWEELVLRAGMACNDDFPDGPWSDTRGLAWLVYLKGPGILRFVRGSSRIALLYPDGVPDDPWTHMDLQGPWEAPDDEAQGWLQSIATARHSTGHWDHVAGRYVSADEVNAGGKACKTTVTHGGVATPCNGVRILGPDDSQELAAAVNVWTVEELNGILSDLEKELSDARSAAGIQ